MYGLILGLVRLLSHDAVRAYYSANFTDVLFSYTQDFLNQTVIITLLVFIVIEMTFYFLNKLFATADNKIVKYSRMIAINGFFFLLIFYYLNIQHWFPSMLSNSALLYYIIILAGNALLLLLFNRIRNKIVVHDSFKSIKLPVITVIVLLLFSNVFSYFQKSKLKAETPINVIMIVIDALRAGQLGCYGYDLPTTPNIDAFAQESLRFTSSFSPSNHTKPSTASLFTSLYPSQHNVILGNRSNNSGEYFSDVLDESFKTIAEYLYEADYNTAGFLNQGQLRKYLGFAQGFIYYNSRLGRAPQINREFLRWLPMNKHRKFFAYIHYLDVHGPYDPPEKYRKIFNVNELTSEIPERAKNWRKFKKDFESGALEFTPEDLENLKALYNAELKSVDDQLGILFQELKRQGVYENSLIIITADHGESFVEHGEIDHGSTLFDEVLRVPLIIHYPNQEKTGVVDANVQTLDLLPTILDYLNITPSKDLMGQSILKYSNGSIEHDEYPIFCERNNLVSLIFGKDKYIFDKIARRGNSIT